MMATVLEKSVAQSSVTTASTLAGIVDRWIFVFMSALFVVTTLVGFIPSALGKIAAVHAGQRPPFPLVLHVHGVLMASWLLLLLVQTVLMATGRREFHRQLGVIAILLAPAMVVTGIILVPTMFHQSWAMLAAAPPGVPPAQIETGKNFIRSLVGAQAAVGLLFPLFVTLALLASRKDAGMHKRLMILATVVPLPAAIDRIAWLPTTYPDSAVSPLLYPVLWIMPMLVWDLVRHRTLHRAYVVWFAFYAPMAALVINLWWSPWWMETVQRWMGV
jgi:hypothetical protein